MNEIIKITSLVTKFNERSSGKNNLATSLKRNN